MRSASILTILFIAGCASGTSSPSISPATPDAGGGTGSIGASSDGGPGAADAGGSGSGSGSSDAGPGSSDAGSADAGPAVDGGSADAGTVLDGGSADAGTTAAAAHCDPALDPAAGVTLAGASTSPSCAGLLPAVPSCASEISVCSGWHNGGSGGPIGNTTTRGDSDGAGTIALACANVDVGPSPGFTMFLDGAAGYTKGVHLGDSVWGLPSGMIALTTSYSQRPPPYYDFVTHQGALLGNVAQGSSSLYVSAATIEIVTPEPAPGGVQIFAQQVDVDGSPRGARVAVSDFIPTTTGVTLGGAADDRGGTLVLWSVNGQNTSSGRWLDASGAAATPVFAIAQPQSQIGRAAGLTAGQGVALGDYNGHWTFVVAPGATAVSAPPAWLASRTGSFSLVRGGRAVAFAQSFSKSVEVVAPDGTSCGTLTLPGNASVGTDGTVFAAMNDKTFRIYPQLLR